MVLVFKNALACMKNRRRHESCSVFLNLPYTEAKHRYDAKLSLGIQLKPRNCVHWHKHDPNIESQVESRVIALSVPEVGTSRPLDIEAISPVGPDGTAGKAESDDEGDHDEEVGNLCGP